MKKSLILLVCALLLCAMPSALANSWGLSGDLLDLVTQTNDWNDYISLCDQAGDIAVLKTRYHHVLMAANDGKLETYTKAVFQPDGSFTGKPKLTANETGFSLRYHDGLWFSFVLDNGVYRLHSAKAGDITVTATDSEYRYLATDDYGTKAILARSYALEDFNIELFPASINEVRHLNQIRQSLDSAYLTLNETLVKGSEKGTAPVYSAPFGQSAWRAAKGKAAVGLKGEWWKLRALRNADGDEYYCIRYDVSQRTQRIGYVERSYVDGENTQPWTETDDLLNAPATIVQETWLTDDPDVSQYQQFRLPVNTPLTCLALYDDDYAYVSAEVKNGRVVDGGQIVWGFVPLRDMQLMSVVGTTWEREAMGVITGNWRFAAGGISEGDLLRLRADGYYESYKADEDGKMTNEPVETGSWYVLKHHPDSNMYWNDPEYEIYFLNDDGTAGVHGLTFDSDTFSLTNWEGSGGYERVSGWPKQEDGNG